MPKQKLPLLIQLNKTQPVAIAGQQMVEWALAVGAICILGTASLVIWGDQFKQIVQHIVDALSSIGN